MKDTLEQIIEQCDMTIAELEQNYAIFIHMGGEFMKDMNAILLGQIEMVKQEKIMYQSMKNELHNSLSEQNILAGLTTMH